jgi:creatinine amidohydrolase/Fe(II)-dependent formamide hydrolase-like protein
LTDQELVPDLHYPWEHAAGGETSILMAIRPELVDLSKTLETDTVLQEYYMGQPAHLQRRRNSKNKYIGVLTGTDDDTNDPELTSSIERGQILLEAISKRVADRAIGLLGEIVKK